MTVMTGSPAQSAGGQATLETGNPVLLLNPTAPLDRDEQAAQAPGAQERD
jgi:hypothetical protein